MSFQTIIIVGHLGRDPDMRYTPSGQAVANINLAANRQYTDSAGQSVKETIWFRVSAWGKAAENCNQYLHKGNLVLVEGRLVCDPLTGGPRLYTRQDGAPASSFEVSANTVRFLSGREGEVEAEPVSNEADISQPEDIPF
jgi:single-strand DNA-binding protein